MAETETVDRKVRDGSTMPKQPARSRDLARRNARIANMAAQTRSDGSPRYRQIDLAERFGISQPLVSQIIRNPKSHLYK